MDNEELEYKLKNLPSKYRVTQEDLDNLINSSQKDSVVFWDKETLVSYKLPNGFTVTGRSACVDPANFDELIGLELAKKNAIEQLWQLEGYRKQQEFYEHQLNQGDEFRATKPKKPKKRTT